MRKKIISNLIPYTLLFECFCFLLVYSKKIDINDDSNFPSHSLFQYVDFFCVTGFCGVKLSIFRVSHNLEL